MSALSLIARPSDHRSAAAWQRYGARPESDAWTLPGDNPALRPALRCVKDVPLPAVAEAQFIAKVLTPYRAQARYLRTAQIDGLGEGADAGARRGLFTASGTFSIGESCYIDDTGHFNAVEFNICFNQLAYVVFGKCIDEGLIPELSFIDFDEFRRGQLPCWLIVGVDGVRFSKQLDRNDFRAALRVERMSSVRGTKFFFTTIAFSDSEGVKTTGSVVLSYTGGGK